jgi:hypothetical protein
MADPNTEETNSNAVMARFLADRMPTEKADVTGRYRRDARPVSPTPVRR